MKLSVNTRWRIHQAKQAFARWWITVSFLTVYAAACGSYGWYYG